MGGEGVRKGGREGHRAVDEYLRRVRRGQAALVPEVRDMLLAKPPGTRGGGGGVVLGWHPLNFRGDRQGLP